MSNIARAFLLTAALFVLPSNSVYGSTLLIGNKGEDSVGFVDLNSGKECARIATGRAPHEIAISPDSRQAAVVAYGGTTVDIFELLLQGYSNASTWLPIPDRMESHGWQLTGS